MKEIYSLLKVYANYIKENKITNYSNFNFDILNQYIDVYTVFLDEYKKYRGNARIS